MGLSPGQSRSYTHQRHETTHSHQYDTFIPHPLTSNTAGPGHVADLQTWSNLADFHIESVPPLCYAPVGLPMFHPLLSTRLWNDGNAPSYSDQEMVHYPFSAPKNEHYYPIQTQSVWSDHWDLPIDSSEPMQPSRPLGTRHVSTLIRA